MPLRVLLHSAPMKKQQVAGILADICTPLGLLTYRWGGIYVIHHLSHMRPMSDW